MLALARWLVNNAKTRCYQATSARARDAVHCFWPEASASKQPRLKNAWPQAQPSQLASFEPADVPVIDRISDAVQMQ